jgi:hypothetical protein
MACGCGFITALGHLVVYSGCLRAKIRVSELVGLGIQFLRAKEETEL